MSLKALLHAGIRLPSDVISMPCQVVYLYPIASTQLTALCLCKERLTLYEFNVCARKACFLKVLSVNVIRTLAGMTSTLEESNYRDSIYDFPLLPHRCQSAQLHMLLTIRAA